MPISFSISLSNNQDIADLQSAIGQYYNIAPATVTQAHAKQFCAQALRQLVQQWRHQQAQAAINAAQPVVS